MNGWISLVVFALGAGVLLWLLKLPKQLWTFAAAAMALGAAGYAWQGRPDLPAHYVTAQSRAGEVDSELVKLREMLFGRFNEDDHQFITADAMTRAGSPDYAAQVMLAAVRKYPQDAAMWTGLGLKIAEQDANVVSPASRFAFERAMKLAPTHPGPPFFMGVAYLRANDFRSALPMWEKALELTPKNASYRDEIASRLFLLYRFLAMQMQAQQKARGEPVTPIPGQQAPQPAQ